MDWSLFYGLLTGVTLVTALLSGSEALQKLSLLLLAAWASTNAAVNFLGFHRAWLIDPSVEAAVAAVTALVGYRLRSKAALGVFSLYLIMGGLNVAAILLRRQESYPYYAALNVMFVAQLCCVGVPGAWMAVHRWAVLRRERLSFDPARRAGLEVGP